LDHDKKAKISSISPDRSENPFLFFFKKEKIATDSGTLCLKKQNVSAPKIN
jgi:hypothetical protein